MWRWRIPLGGDPHYLLPYSQNPGAQQWHPFLRHCPSPGGGQQGPWRPTSDQILDWHPQVEASFQFQYDSLAKQVQNTWVHQGSKGSLWLLHQESRSPLLTSHPRGGELGGCSGLLHSTITCQRHSASGRKVPWGGEKRSTQLSLHLPSHPGC